jgi:hypothetical protein
MRRILLFILPAILWWIPPANGQIKNNDTQVILRNLFAGITSDISDSEKLGKNDSIQIIINSYIRSDSVFVHRFNDIRYLGQITSKDSRLKIIAWNLLLRDTTSRYYCYFINKQKDSNKIYKLTAMYNKDPVRVDEIYSQNDWYGAMYYDLRPVKKDNQVFWMLLGIDYGNPAITRKIIDVLSFTPDGGMVFGKKWFQSGPVTKYREVLEYGFAAVISLRFLNDKFIVFDHLVPVSPEYKDNREFYGPDFSYDAYRYEKGVWQFKVNVDVRNPEK